MADCFAVEPEDMFPEPSSHRSTASAPAKMMADDLDLDMPLKKKKKKKITFDVEPLDEEGQAVAVAVAVTDIEGLDVDFSKKKKKKKGTEADTEDVDLDVVSESNSSKKKKKSTGTDDPITVLNATNINDGRNWGPYMEPDLEEITYEQMLKRVYMKLHEANPELCGDRAKARIKPPKVSRLGTTRSCWENFGSCCKSMNRGTDHVQSFYLAELDTTGAIDGDGNFVIKGRYNNKHIEGIMGKYITQYVQCHTCKSLDTEITRDSITRLSFICCNLCKSQRSIMAIKAGYHATTKADRKAARES